MDFRVMGPAGGTRRSDFVKWAEGAGTVAGRWLAGGLESIFHLRRRLATIVMCLAAALLGFHVLSGPNGWMAFHKKKLENRALQLEVERLQKGNEDLERRVRALRSDPKAIEREAREQLRYAKPGEIIYVMPDQKPPAPVIPPANATAEKTTKP
jgi:cell division protein FtsB